VHSSPDQKLEKSHEDPKKNEEISKSIVLRRAKIIMIWILGIKRSYTLVFCVSESKIV